MKRFAPIFLLTLSTIIFFAARPVSAQTASPTSLTFSQGVGTTSEEKLVQIRNNGILSLAVNSVTLNGADAARFEIFTDTCGTSIPALRDCMIGVRYTPDDLTADAATLDVDVAGGTDPSIALTGNPFVGPGVSTNPADLDFGDVGVGNTSLPQLVQVTNNGTTDLTVNGVTLDDGTDFAVIGNTCDGAVVAPGGSCVVQVICSPTVAGALSDSLEIDSDAASSPDSVALDCDGVEGPAIALNSSALTFGSVFVGSTDVPQLVQVTNIGTTVLSIASVANAGPDFSLVSDACSGQSVAPGGSCVLSVIFHPTAAGNPLTDTFIITSDSVNAPNDFTVDGVGLQSVISASGSGAFGSVNAGNQGGPNTITVTNTDVDANLILGSVVRIGADTRQFSIRNDNCSNQTLAPGDNCTFQAVFSPTEGGAFTDTVLIPNNSATPSFTFGLSGTGVMPAAGGLLQIKTNVLDFDLEVGGSSSQSTNVTNIGGASVTVNALTLEGDANFGQINDCEGQTLASGESCTITATFSAGGGSGNFSAVVTVDSNPETTDFLVLLGSSFFDEVGGGGCSLVDGNKAVGAAWLWMGFVAAFAVGLLRRRACRA